MEQSRARNPRVFGSVLHGRDTETSDLDVLIDPTPGTTLLDLGGLQVMLEELLGVQLDLLTPGDLPKRARSGAQRSRPNMTSGDSGLRLVDILDHIEEASRLAREYVAGMSKESFSQRPLHTAGVGARIW